MRINKVNGIIDFLNQPFPDSTEDNFKNASITGIVVFIILYSFKPFGLQEINNLFPICLAYGIITFFIDLLYYCLLYTSPSPRDS